MAPPRPAIRSSGGTSGVPLNLQIDDFLDASIDGIVVLGADGRICLANTEIERMFDIPVNALVGQLAEVLIPEGLPVAVAEDGADSTSRQTRRTQDTRSAMSGRRAGGTEIPVNVRLFPTTPDSGSLTIVVIRDATSERLAERAVWESRELAEQLNRAQRLETVGRLAGGVAHDFNNLLQVIGGYAETLLVDDLSDEQRRLLMRIRKATDRASALTRQLLAFGRRQVLRPRAILLSQVISGLDSILTRVIGEHIRLEVVADPQLKAVMVDPGQIEQVLLNLVINARDAIGENGGRITISAKNFELNEPLSHRNLPVVIPHGSWVQVCVEDTGCGMDEDTTSRAFEPFFTTKVASEGTGLGLSMVYGIIKQSGGYTWIESASSAGTTVSMILPAFEGPTEDDEPAATVVNETVAAGQGTVLLVEDEEAVRELLASFLKEVGYTVLEAVDGSDALSVFSEHSGKVDLIVTDVVMPHMSGPSLAQAVRAVRPGTKILYVSGYTEKSQLGSKDEEDDTAHLQKPVTRAEFLTRVADLLRC